MTADKIKILIVDDDVSLLRILKIALAEDGYQLFTAENALDGLEILSKNQVQLVLSDQRMPRMTGLEFLIQVKQLYPDIARILLSSHEDFEVIKEAINNEAISKYLSKPFSIELLRKTVSESLSSNVRQKESERLLTRLMNYAKLSGLKINQPTEAQLVLEDELRQALHKNQFIIYYQPIVAGANGRIMGAEALLRWQHPSHGLLGPNHFVSLCEEMGLINNIWIWTLDQVCKQLKQWQQQTHPGLFAAVNLSANQLNQAELTAIVKEVLISTQIEPKCLEIEITESLLMQDIEVNIMVLHALKELGIKLSLDDFGTGYSSLNYLKDLPVNTLKIDKSFIDNIEKNKNCADIVDTIIKLAKSLNLTVIAEGIEHDEQRTVLNGSQCDLMQGYFFSKPVPSYEFSQLLKHEYLPRNK
jgi:EAL domain-containing protein (putative c-di-GMP-specific phosphodiesterase class I)/DNA-binding NarL/FixJ family response regulator